MDQSVQEMKHGLEKLASVREHGASLCIHNLRQRIGGLGQYSEFHVFLFVFLQRGQVYLSLASVRSMHCYAVVAQSQLGESLRIAAHLGSLGPSIAIAVEAKAAHSD